MMGFARLNPSYVLVRVEGFTPALMAEATPALAACGGIHAGPGGDLYRGPAVALVHSKSKFVAVMNVCLAHR
jgi:hypothetical protein